MENNINDLEKEIIKLEHEIFAIKIEINSNFYSNIYHNSFHLVEKRANMKSKLSSHKNNIIRSKKFQKILKN